MIFIGLDPGVGGGLAALTETGGLVAAVPMPDTPRGVFDWLDITREKAHGDRVRAFLEKVNPGVFGAGKTGKMGVVSAYTFGRGIGRLEAALAAAGISYDEVLPAKWQTALGCRSGGDKNVTKRRAAALFPNVKMTHHLADALLIAEYGRRFELRMIE